MKNKKKPSKTNFGIYGYEYNNLTLNSNKTNDITSQSNFSYGIHPKVLFYILGTACITIFLELLTYHFVYHSFDKTPPPSQKEWRSERSLYASHFTSYIQRSLQDSTITPKELQEISRKSTFFLDYHYKHKISYTPPLYPSITTSEYKKIITTLQSHKHYHSTIAGYYITSAYLLQDINYLQKHIKIVQNTTTSTINIATLYTLHNKFMTSKRYYPHLIVDALMNSKKTTNTPRHD